MDKTFYYCDPNLNRKCRKTSCFLRGGPCEATNNIEYAMRNKYGVPVIKEGKENEDSELH